MNLPFLLHTGRDRPSVPRPGSSLARATEARARYIRSAVDVVRQSLGRNNSVAAVRRELFGSRWLREPHSASDNSDVLAAWNLIAMRVVARSLGVVGREASLRDTENWFLGSTNAGVTLSSCVSKQADAVAVQTLELATHDDQLQDLLPYILDAHGPGSRASVMRDPSTSKARNAKRAAGAFYTPSDVADYIVTQALDRLDPIARHPRILDPACGSGVFLRAALAWAIRRDPKLNRFRFVDHALFAIDINPLAVESACFVLLHDCLVGTVPPNRTSPWSLWHRIRCNLFVGDALRICLASATQDGSAVLRELRASLASAFSPPAQRGLTATPTTDLFAASIALGAVFPQLGNGADAIVGNPPYAALGVRDDSIDLKNRYVSLPAGDISKANCFPLFVEMMWQLARTGSHSSGMVVPLSIAHSTRQQMITLRRSIMQSGGRWRFAFFDREPHALFGEEVKTRNTIVFRSQQDDCPECSSIETGPLRKWTSHQRKELFTNIHYTPLVGHSIINGIPKLAGTDAAEAYSQVTGQGRPLGEECSAVASCLPAEATSRTPATRVFVAGTAYNFLNVFRPHLSLPPQQAPWSSSKLLTLDFRSEAKAACAFAILTSRLVFWLWRVTEDGFHVNRTFVQNLPLGQALRDYPTRLRLQALGTQLWHEVQTQQVVSINRGRQSVAYRPYGNHNLREAIDELLLGTLRVPSTFAHYLSTFTRASVSVTVDLAELSVVGGTS